MCVGLAIGLELGWGFICSYWPRPRTSETDVYVSSVPCTCWWQFLYCTVRVSDYIYHARGEYCRAFRNVYNTSISNNKLCGRPPQYAPAPCKLTFDLLTLKVVSESRMTWATLVPISVFLGLSVLDLGLMYATDRQTSDAHHRLMPPALWAGA